MRVSKGEKMERKQKITEKDKELIKLVAEGCLDAEIGNRMDIAYGTVRYRLDKLYAKTATVNRPHLVYWAFKNGLLN